MWPGIVMVIMQEFTMLITVCYMTYRYLACFVCTTSSRFFMRVFGIMILKEIYKQVTISFYLILLSMIIQKRILLQFIINASS